MSAINCGDLTYKQTPSSSATNETSNCTASGGAGCVNPTNDGEKCLCAAGYGQNTTDKSCAPCIENTYSDKPSSFACDPCTSNSVGVKGTSDDGNTGCECMAGFAASQMDSGSTTIPKTCDPCKDGQFKPSQGNAQCGDCKSNQIGVPATGNISQNTTGPNTQCFCTNTSEAMFNTNCIACFGDGYQITNGECLCASGYSQDLNTGICNKSSASPLAIALICALFIFIAASIATAAVAIKRKAAARRTAVIIISDAL